MIALAAALVREQTLDLASRYHDVRRLVCAHPAFRRAVREGYDPDDLRQEVLLELVALQHRPGSVYQPGRASLSKYVYMVTWTAVAQVKRKRRHLEEEQADPLDEGESTGFEHADTESQIRVACEDMGLDQEDAELAVAVAMGRVSRLTREVVALAGRIRWARDER